MTTLAHPEQQYLDLLHHILEHGDDRIDRTGVGTRSIFGAMHRFDLSGGVVPILTTKRVYWKTAIKEMLWFLKGETNIRSLLKENVRIWTDWPLAAYRKETGDQISQETFERRILEDDEFAEKYAGVGKIYGSQWRRWSGPDGRTYDQIASVIDLLKNSPTSRRILFHGWNVADIGGMALPPCHLLYQYYVDSSNRIHCIVFQRSVDCILGLPFNYTGAVALQYMLAQQAGLSLGTFTWFGGDVHIY